MSLPFRNSTTKHGIIERIEKTLFGEGSYGHISNNANRLAMFTSEVNLALDHALSIIFEADGRWQFDDGNHTDFPIITTNLVQGQRDYTFTSDEGGNLILDVYKVAVKGTSTAYYTEIGGVDTHSDRFTEEFYSGQDVQGIPSRYDKLANGIFLDPVPSATVTNGLKVYINREASYFTTTDTTKKAGFAGIFHEYLVLRPAYTYARDKGLKNKKDIEVDMLRMEKALEDYYGRREADERHIFRGVPVNHL